MLYNLISKRSPLPLQMHDLELQLRRSQLDRGNSVAESVMGRDWRTQEVAHLKQEVTAKRMLLNSGAAAERR